jgi:hypothetical protein
MRIYIDTSVLGGYFDPEFQEWPRLLIKEFQNGKKIAVISDITLEEIEKAPPNIQQIIQLIPDNYLEKVSLSKEAKNLAEKYLLEKIVTKKYLLDAQHIALATTKKVDVVVSWNFKHLVNFTKIKLYNSVNLKYGFSMIEIRTPREVLDE